MDKRLPKSTDYNKYLYIDINPIGIRLLYILGIISWTLTVYGFVRFFNLSIWHWIFFGPVVALLTLHNYLNFGIQLFVKKFDLDLHNKFKKDFWNKLKKQPEIDILIPVCGEDLRILENTFSKAKAIDYENKKIFILDDKGEESVKALTKKLGGLVYLSRPNKGHMKKAGNLLFGYQQCKGEYIAVFDADFAPHPDFVIELLPYFQEKKIAIVQSPHYFAMDNNVHERSPIEYGSSNLQEQFYLTIQNARDRFGAAICAGSNTIYRKSALDEIGGPTQVDHGEDVNTGLDLINKGYKIKYIPIIVAKGLSPHTLQQFYKQQNRWSSSSTGMLISGKIFSDKLTIAQRLCYASGITYYLSQIAYLILPFQMLLVFGFHADGVTFDQAMPFIPYIVYSIIILPFFSRKSQPRFGTYLATVSTLYIHTYTVILRFFGKPATWVPTNSISHGIERGFEFLNDLSLLFITIFLIGISILIYTFNFPILNLTFITLTFWVFYIAIMHFSYLFQHSAVIYKHKNIASQENISLRRDFNLWKFRLAGTLVAVILIFSITSNYSLKTTNAQVLFTTRTKILNELNQKNENRPLVAKVPSKENTNVLGVKDSAVEEIANGGDSVALLARKAIKKIARESKIDLKDYQKIYIETNLIKSDYSKSVEVGEKVSFSTSDIKKYINESKQLDNQSINNWQAWANMVDYSNY